MKKRRLVADNIGKEDPEKRNEENSDQQQNKDGVQRAAAKKGSKRRRPAENENIELGVKKIDLGILGAANNMHVDSGLSRLNFA